MPPSVSVGSYAPTTYDPSAGCVLKVSSAAASHSAPHTHLRGHTVSNQLAPDVRESTAGGGRTRGQAEYSCRHAPRGPRPPAPARHPHAVPGRSLRGRRGRAYRSRRGRLPQQVVAGAHGRVGCSVRAHARPARLRAAVLPGRAVAGFPASRKDGTDAAPQRPAGRRGRALAGHDGGTTPAGRGGAGVEPGFRSPRLHGSSAGAGAVRHASKDRQCRYCRSGQGAATADHDAAVPSRRRRAHVRPASTRVRDRPVRRSPGTGAGHRRRLRPRGRYLEPGRVAAGVRLRPAPGSGYDDDRRRVPVGSGRLRPAPAHGIRRQRGAAALLPGRAHGLLRGRRGGSDGARLRRPDHGCLGGPGGRVERAFAADRRGAPRPGEQPGGPARTGRRTRSRPPRPTATPSTGGSYARPARASTRCC